VENRLAWALADKGIYQKIKKLIVDGGANTLTMAQPSMTALQILLG